MAKNLILWLFIAVVLMMVFKNFSGQESVPAQTDYTTFLSEVERGDIREVKISQNEIRGVKRNGETFVTYIPYRDDQLMSDLSKFNVRAYGEAPKQTSVLTQIFISWFPILLLIGVWIFFMRQMQGGGGRGAMSFGKSKAKLLTEEQIKTTFADVAGCDEAKEDVAELVDFLRDPTKFQKLGGKIPKGILMVGPPGTGKTLLAKAIAGEAKVPFFAISGSDFVEMFVGVGASRVRDMFEQAKKSSPCIIFIDEIDAVGRQRGAGLGGGHDEREQTLNQMLVEMDMRKVPLGDDVEASVIARGTPGFSGADLANLVNEAALFAARTNRRLVSMEEFDKAKDKIMMGAERKSMVMTEEEKTMTAYHEAGHAIVGRLVPEHDPVYKVSIIPRGRALGVTMYLPEQDRVSYNKRHLESMISSLYGGRIAEDVIYGEEMVTTGASNDSKPPTGGADLDVGRQDEPKAEGDGETNPSS